MWLPQAYNDDFDDDEIGCCVCGTNHSYLQYNYHVALLRSQGMGGTPKTTYNDTQWQSDCMSHLVPTVMVQRHMHY